MDKTTIVLPSARAIRHEQLHIDDSSIFLPNYITMSDFISKLCIVKDFKIVDEDSRVLLLLEASDFNAFASLRIERNFFTFTKNSSYIFKFFQELSAELCDINTLALADIYAEYEEHISILTELYARYEKLCLEKKILDKIFLPKLYSFNEDYAATHKNIEIHVDGHLTNFELELLQKCTPFSSVNLIFSATAFNKKMQDKFLELGIELEVSFVYTLSLNDKSILSKEKISKQSQVSCESFSESLLQVAFIKRKLYEFVNKGYKPENIAVILPEESMAKTLRSFDEKANFNFAMGEAYTQSSIYVKLNATVKTMDQKSQENFHRLERVGDELYMPLLGIYHKKSSEVDFIEFLANTKEFFKVKNELKIYEEEIHKFKTILPSVQEMSVKSLLSIFMSRLASRTLDDVRGGKVTVMGVLETRSVAFDGVIIVDFSDKNVPKRSDKDMFLNTKIRTLSNLPTMSDRENLQKHYYEMLINNSKEVALSFVNSGESSESRFLKQLGIRAENIYDESEYAAILFTKEQREKKVEEEIIQAYSFKDIELSATRLKTFLTCKRKYYFSYVKHIKGHEIPKDMPKEYEIGNAVHLALKELYSKRSTYDSVERLKKDLHKALDDAKGESELDNYLIAMQKKRMDSFCTHEIQRFSEGWHVVFCEERMRVSFAGMTLVGQIDRIDKRDDEIEVLDYKTGSYTLYNKNNFTEAVDFQLEFYYLLAGGLGNISCAFYDLKESKIVPESFLNEKLSILESNIKDLLNIQEVNFAKCEDTKPCQFCDYAIMCGR
jgi:RecB family exonuclease